MLWYDAGDQREDLAFASISLGKRSMRGSTAAIAPSSARPYIVRRSSLNVSPHGAESYAWPRRGSRRPLHWDPDVRSILRCGGSALLRVLLLVIESDRWWLSSGCVFKAGKTERPLSVVASVADGTPSMPSVTLRPRGRADAPASAEEIRHGRSGVGVHRWQWRRQSREMHGQEKMHAYGMGCMAKGSGHRRQRPVP